MLQISNEVCRCIHFVFTSFSFLFLFVQVILYRPCKFLKPLNEHTQDFTLKLKAIISIFGYEKIVSKLAQSAHLARSVKFIKKFSISVLWIFSWILFKIIWSFYRFFTYIESVFVSTRVPIAEQLIGATICIAKF